MWLHTCDDAALACLRALSLPLGGGCLCNRSDAAELLNLGGQALAVVDARGRVVCLNGRAEHLLGRRAEDALGRTCRAGLGCTSCPQSGDPTPLRDEHSSGPAGRDAGGHAATGGADDGLPVLACLSGGAARATVFRDPDGHPRRLLLDSSPLHDPSGSTVGAVISIHRLAAATDQVAPSAPAGDCRLHALISGSVDPSAIVVSPDGTVASLGLAAACQLGTTSIGSRGRPLADLFDASAPVEDALAAVLAGDEERVVADVAPRGRREPITLRMRHLLSPTGALLGALVDVERTGARPALTGVDGWEMVCASPSMQRIAGLVRGLAGCDATVLITGESGTGKEVVARAIHGAGPRASRPFHAVNCAALTPDLVESELFGHERGAFTGAVRDKPGRFEVCADGTLLLDEVGCLPLPLQAKLLRVLDTRSFERVGGTRSHPLRARILAATNADLDHAVREGTFRADLFYRLAVVPLELPPLCTRPEDVLPLAGLFARQLTGAEVRFTAAAARALTAHGWPGNVREVRNAIQFALALGARSVIDAADLPPAVRHVSAVAQQPPTSERRAIELALERAGTSRVEAAQLLGVSRTTLWRRMRELGIG